MTMSCNNTILHLYHRIKNIFKCPPQKQLSKLLTIIFCLGFIYICLYSFGIKSIKEHLSNCSIQNDSLSTRFYGANIFVLFTLFVSAIIAGNLMFLMKLPQFLGMLIMGFILRNLPNLNLMCISNIWSSNIRTIALTVILLRIGLSIDSKIVKKLNFVVLRLACTPCFVEATVVGVVSYYLLKLPFGWSLIMGFVLSAVSPTIVPSILQLKKRHLGVDKGVNTLVITAASMDDVLAIIGFGITLGSTFFSGNLIMKFFRGPLEALAGVSFGIIFGVTLWFLPSNDNDKFDFYRIVALYVSAIGAMYGSTAFTVPGAGPLAVLTLSFVASVRWKEDPMWTNKGNPVIKTTELLWWLLQPFLFGLNGADLDIQSEYARLIGFSIITIVIGLLCRLLVTFIVLFGTNFDTKEKLFVAIAWLPKATIQAAIGPMALDLAIKDGKSIEFIKYGKLILAVAVISILLTAPLGAALISLTGSLLLKKSSDEQGFDDRELKNAVPESQRLFQEEIVETI